MKKLANEFKEFALQGNMFAMAVGVLIGASFQGLVTSLTDNIISPLLSIFVSENFASLYIEVAGANVTYGAFISDVINFVIMAFIIFMFVRAANKLTKSKKEENIDG